MIALWITLWTSSHAPVTHLLAAIALPAVTHQSRNPGNKGHGTSHASHAPRAVTLAPLFSKGARVLRTRPSHALTTHRHVRYCTPMAPRSAEERAHALDLLRQEHTPAEVAEVTGIPRRTIAQWATNAGIETSPQAAAKTAKARAVLQATADERRANLATKLLEVAEAAALVEIDRITDGSASLHEIVGARTRAIHDMQLLTGQATQRAEVTAPERTPEQEHELARVLELVRTEAAA